jgi:hypothetical protein
MRTRSTVVIVALALVGFVVVGAQAGAPTDSTPEKMVENFFQICKLGNTDEAFDLLWSTNLWAERKKDAAQKLKTQLRNLTEMVGPLRDTELLTKREMGTRLVYLSYLAAFDRQPIRFEFHFDRPSQRWGVLNIAFDDDMDEDLRRAGRIASIINR